MNVTLRQLHAFITVADLGSFTEGAKRMHLSQPALSALVKELEDTLGIRLFDRTTRSVQISTAGKEFYPLATKVLQDLNNAVEAATSLRDGRSGTVRVASTLLYAATVVTDAIAAYRTEYTGIHVQIIDTQTPDVLTKVLGEEVDLGVAPQWGTHPEIERAPLFRDPFYLVCDAHHELAKQESAIWSDLLNHDFIGLTRGFTTRLQLDLAASSGELLSPAHEVSYVTTALSMVKAGMGVTALPVSVRPLADAYQLKMLPLNNPVITRDICVFTKQGRTLSPSAKAFLTILRKRQSPPSLDRRDRCDD